MICQAPSEATPVHVSNLANPYRQVGCLRLIFNERCRFPEFPGYTAGLGRQPLRNLNHGHNPTKKAPSNWRSEIDRVADPVFGQRAIG